MNIEGKTILVTGASRGIGMQLCQEFALRKCRIIGVSRKLDVSWERQLVEKGASSCRRIETDLSSPENVQKLLKALENERVDILVNNAGLLTGGLLEEQGPEEIQQMLQVNVNALIQLTRGLLPGMLQRKSGKIVNNSSVSGIMHFPCASTYSASKAAVVAFTTCLQQELKKTGVSALLLITPGVETEMFQDIPKKYGRNLNVSLLKSIPADVYAKRVLRSIEKDEEILTPNGTQGMGVFMARVFPSLFYSAVSSQFKRSP